MESSSPSRDTLMKDETFIQENNDFPTISDNQQPLSHHYDLMQMILSYLSRKNKYLLQQINRDFRAHIVPRSMVTLNFKGSGNVTQSQLF